MTLYAWNDVLGERSQPGEEGGRRRNVIAEERSRQGLAPCFRG